MSKVIALIGIDGSGKSTHAELLCNALKKHRFKVKVIYAGNTGVRLGRRFSFYLSLPIDVVAHELLGLHDRSALSKYRVLLKLENFLLFLNYVILILPKILLYRKKYEILIADRYVYDYILLTVAQKRYSRTLTSVLLRMVPKPTVTILLDVDPLIAYQRKSGEKSVNELLLLRRLYSRFIANTGGTIVDTSCSKANTLKEILRSIEPCVLQK